MTTITLAVDCMGGDHGPRVTLAACRHFLDSASRGAALLLVGAPDALSGFQHPRARIVAATEVVGDGRPGRSGAAQEEGFVDARGDPAGQGRRGARRAVSAGNTGALMALARYLLKTLDGIDRPGHRHPAAQCQGRRHHRARPGRQRRLHRAAPAAVRRDGLGAGVGADGRRISPRSGLLNIGEEAIKGNEIIKKAGELLRAAAAAGDLNFYGNVEGNDIFKGTTDIVVCDGFVGNVALKTSEGAGVDDRRLPAGGVLSHPV